MKKLCLILVVIGFVGLLTSCVPTVPVPNEYAGYKVRDLKQFKSAVSPTELSGVDIQVKNMTTQNYGWCGYRNCPGALLGVDTYAREIPGQLKQQIDELTDNTLSSLLASKFSVERLKNSRYTILVTYTFEGCSGFDKFSGQTCTSWGLMSKIFIIDKQQTMVTTITEEPFRKSSTEWGNGPNGYQIADTLANAVIDSVAPLFTR